jgi:hypothetical protein
MCRYLLLLRKGRREAGYLPETRYIEDYRRQTLLLWVAFATIFIACLCLFGLATYSAEQRFKEIGIRKVLGASVLNVTALLSKDFMILVLIANGLAFPSPGGASRCGCRNTPTMSMWRGGSFFSRRSRKFPSPELLRRIVMVG